MESPVLLAYIPPFSNGGRTPLDQPIIWPGPWVLRGQEQPPSISWYQRLWQHLRFRHPPQQRRGLHVRPPAGRLEEEQYARQLGVRLGPHDDSDFLTIHGTEVYDNGYHGIIASKRCNGVSIQVRSAMRAACCICTTPYCGGHGQTGYMELYAMHPGPPTPASAINPNSSDHATG